MRLAKLTRLDGEPVGISIREIVRISPSLRTPEATRSSGTQVFFRHGGQQEVKETFAEVLAAIDNHS